MTINTIATPKAPAAIGPYSQAVKAGNLVFISGQLPIDPETGTMVEGDIKEKTHRVMQNLRAICEAAGAGLDSVVKTTIYLTDLSQFKAVNETYGEYFADNPPARVTVQVAALPLDSQIEIDAVVYLHLAQENCLGLNMEHRTMSLEH